MASTLALEMRPKTFDEYMGIDIRNTLVKRMSREEDYPHTFLFYGTRGCGKTTAARLLAKEFLCLDKVNGHACGQCAACLEVEENLIDNRAGMYVPAVIELDIATDSNKSAIDNVLEDVIEPPMYPFKYKILILDECHMASKQAQNRLLKITEEPPEHLILIFCTTDPDMMLETLVDRCQLKVQVKKADLKEMTDRMLKCCELKGWTTGMKALEVIAKRCDRNPRRCWNALEDISSKNNGRITLEEVTRYYGGVDDNLYFNYYEAAKEGIESILVFINDINEKGIEYKDFLGQLVGFTLNCIEVRFSINLDSQPSSFQKLAKKFFGEYTAQMIDTLLQILEHANTMASSAHNDPDILKLVISNTALRIGKIGLLSKGLQNEYTKVNSENVKGQMLYEEKVRKEGKGIDIKAEDVSDDLLASVFGSNVTEIVAGDKSGLLPVEEDEDTDEDVWTEDMLLSLTNV